MSDDPYVYPGTSILRNKLGLHDVAELDRVERRMAIQRAREGVPSGDFDLKHLQAIHRHLFQDIYDWAGEIRTVEIAKNGQPFMFRQYIRTGMEDVHRRIRDGRYLRGSSPDAFAEKAGMIIGDVNHIHPFREGNGRTQMFYLKQLAERAGHQISLERVNGEQWIEASILANQGEYAAMSKSIRAALVDPTKEQIIGDKLSSREEQLKRLRDGVTKHRGKDRGDHER